MHKVDTLLGFLGRKIRLYPVVSSLIAALTGAVLAIEAGALSRSEPEVAAPLAATPDNVVPINRLDNPPPDDDLQQQLTIADPALGQLLADGNYSELRELMLQRAAAAVAAGEQQKLGHTLILLGQIAIREQALPAAQVYLQEALDIFAGLSDDIGAAKVNLQLARAHLRSRQVARIAGTAYDELQIGRWFLANDLAVEAEKYIRTAINRNLSINRYGSAASAHESLVRLFLANGDLAQAETELIVAAGLFAAAGRDLRARNLITMAASIGVPAHRVATLKQQVETNLAQYRNEILQVERAKDYQRLYNYYTQRGDHDRAWHFRLLSDNSLAQVSRRTLFHRQQGVLALLYNANDDLHQARNYLTRADFTFAYNGLTDLSAHTHSLQQQMLPRKVIRN